MRNRSAAALLLALGLLFPSFSALAGEAKDLYKCDMCGRRLGENCCCMREATADQDCRSARAWVSEHVPEPNRSSALKSNDCNYIKNTASIWSWKSQDDLRDDAIRAKRKLDDDAIREKRRLDNDARTAKMKSDSDARVAKIKSDGDARTAKIKADNDAVARDIFDKANHLQKDLDNGVTPSRPRQSNPGLGDPGIDPSPRPTIPPDSTDPAPPRDPATPVPAREPDEPTPRDPANPPSDGPPPQDPQVLRTQRMADELLDLAKRPRSTPNSPPSQGNFDDLLPSHSSAGSSAQPQTPVVSQGDLINAAKAGVGAYRDARQSGETELPHVGEELFKQGLQAISPPTLGDVDVQAVHDRNNKLAKQYGLSPANPQKSQAGEMTDRFMDLLPGSQAKSNVGDLAKLRDETVGLIDTILRAIDKLFHASDEKKDDRGGKPAVQDKPAVKDLYNQ